MFNKRGAGEGKAIASLIMVIALAIALYVILIPPEERQALLEGDITDEIKDTVKSLELLSEAPGQLSPRQETGTVHSINAINLFIKTEPEIIRLADHLQVKRSLVTKSSPTLRFDANNLNNLNKASLYFTTQEPQGTLKLKINGEQFYSKELTGGVKVIDIPTIYIQETNQIQLTASSPGLAFWRTNEFNLQDVGVRLEYERINAKETRTFQIAQQELESLTEADLKYTMVCNAPLQQNTANLRIILNDLEIIDSQIRCVSTEQIIELEKNHLRQGQNEVTFIIDDGEFAFNQLKLETKSDEITHPTYFFTVSSKEMQRIEELNKEAILEIFLEDNNKAKNARLNINDETIFMTTQESKFTYDITDLLDTGTNFIRIQPTTTFTMVGLKLTIE